MWQRDYFFKIISLEPDPFSELTRLLLKLKKNEDSCGRKVLETKYRDAYIKLKIQIRICVQAIVFLELKSDADIKGLSTEKTVEMLNNALLYMATDENMAEVCDVAYNSYDEKKTLDYTYFLLQRMEKIFLVDKTA